MLEKAIDTTRNGKYTYIQYVRYADDLVILIDSYSRHDWLVKAVEKRLREELAKLRVEINEEKAEWWTSGSREVSDSWGSIFAASEVLKGVAAAVHAKAEEANGGDGEAQGHFPATCEPTCGAVIEMINPILRGWVNYFAVGHSGRCFTSIKDW